jgi:hypothetical protein
LRESVQVSEKSLNAVEHEREAPLQDEPGRAHHDHERRVLHDDGDPIADGRTHVFSASSASLTEICALAMAFMSSRAI